MTEKNRQITALEGLLAGFLLLGFGWLAGCAARVAPRPPAPHGVDVHVAPDTGLRQLRVEACSRGVTRYRRWATPWTRVTVEEGAREGDVLRASARGCVAYRVALQASRSTLLGNDAVVSAQSEWLLRPVGQVDEVRVRFALPEGLRVATPWPALVDQHDAPQDTRGRHVSAASADTPGTPETDAEGAAFVLPSLALQLPSDVLFGRFELSRRVVGVTELQVARVAGPLPHGQEELVTHIARAVELVASVGGAFPSERVLAVVWPSPSDQPVQFGLTKRGGGASILLFFGENAAAGSLADDWVTVHELAHLLHPLVPSADRWLTEGIATYYQEVLRARAGWKTPAVAWTRIIEGFEAGRRGGTGRSLRDEALGMHQSAAYTRVYWGGAAFVLAADLQLRARGSSFDEAIARCLREVQRSARPVSAQELVRALDPQLLVLAEEYAARSEWAPTDALLSELGLVYADGAVQFVDAPGSDVRDAIMRGSTGASRQRVVE
ncbi:MAG: hypothetical protein H6725_19805 [Sandaracinaceae bacterium]|nr:hypothetical protein [Sandaracinaceae bacterium]